MLTSLPTESLEDLTQEGVVLGTVPYMAPEQLEGKEADARTDIFAFGAVLMRWRPAGRPSRGASQASLIAAILSSEPPSLSSIQPATPPALERLVRTCLAKDPDERWQSAGDVARELKWIAEGSAAGGSVAPPRRTDRRSVERRLAWAVAAVAILVAALLALLRPPIAGARGADALRGPRPPGQSFIELRRALSRTRGASSCSSGTTAERTRSPCDRSTASTCGRLPGTDDVRGAFWSPDGREIAFFSEGKLKRVSADGGPARTVCDSEAASAAPGVARARSSSRSEFGGPLFAVPAAGGAPRRSR